MDISTCKTKTPQHFFKKNSQAHFIACRQQQKGSCGHNVKNYNITFKRAYGKGYTIVANSPPPTPTPPPLAGHTRKRAQSPASCSHPPQDPQTALFTPLWSTVAYLLKIISWFEYLYFIYLYDNCLKAVVIK